MSQAKVFLLVSISALLCGCANSKFYDSPELAADSYQLGEVVRVELVVPRYSVAGGCLLCQRQRPPLKVNLEQFRGDFGPFLLTQDGEPDVGMPYELEVTKLWGDAVYPQADGWAIHTTVLSNEGREITVIGSSDYLLSAGDRVRLGFGNPGDRAEAELVSLSPLRDE